MLNVMYVCLSLLIVLVSPAEGQKGRDNHDREYGKLYPSVADSLIHRLDFNSQPVGWKDMPLHLRPTFRDSLLMSRIAVVEQSEEAAVLAGSPNLIIGDAVIRKLKFGEPIRVLFEIYNLMLDRDHISDFTVKLKVEQVEKKGNFISGIFSVFGGRENRIVETEYNRSEPAQEAFEYLALDLTDFQKGTLRLTVTVTDEIASRSTGGSVEFGLK